MVNIPENVLKLVNDPKVYKVLTTVADDGNPHSIQVGSMMAPKPDMLVVGAILMKHTGANLSSMKNKGNLVAILTAKEMESYQIKAKVKDLVTEGPLFDKMNENLKAIGLAASGVWVLEPAEVWNQSANYEAGKKIA
jgi:hypothetical protein